MDSPQLESRITGYATLRSDVMALADQINKHRTEHLEMIREFNLGITKLVQFADTIFEKALAERDADGVLLKEYRTVNPSPNDIANNTAPSRRSCSLCGQPGHRKDNCPNAHEVQAEQKATVEARTVKVKLEPGKRGCGNCGEAGHRAQNCPKPPRVKKHRKGKK
jgi:hypothetical protein